VVYNDVELGVKAFNRRESILEKGMPECLLSEPYRIIRIHARNYKMQELVPAIIKKIQEENLKVVLIILDNLSFAFGGIDLSKPSVEAKESMLMIKEFCMDIGSGMLTDHHTRKHIRALLSSGDLSTGAGTINDTVDHELIIRKGKSGVRLLVGDKARHSKETGYGSIIDNDGNEAGDLWYQLVGTYLKSQEADYLPMQPDSSGAARGISDLDEKEKIKIVVGYKLNVEGINAVDLAKQFNTTRQTIKKWSDEAGVMFS